MMNRLIVWLNAGVLVLAAGQAAADDAQSRPLACLILPDRVADLGSPVIGVVDSIDVDRGDVVKQGQIVARLVSQVERANAYVARSRAEADSDLRAAINNEVLSRQQLERAEKLVGKHYLSDQEVDKLRSDHVIALQKVGEAREQLRTAASEVDLSQAQLSQRTIKSPFDGVVVERYANPGEHVEEKPLLKIASVDPLRVEVVVPIDMFGKIQIGQDASVSADLPDAAPRSARVTEIDSVMDPASNTFRLRLSMDNADRTMPAGLRCKISFPEAVGKHDAGQGTQPDPAIKKTALVEQSGGAGPPSP